MTKNFCRFQLKHTGYGGLPYRPDRHWRGHAGWLCFGCLSTQCFGDPAAGTVLTDHGAPFGAMAK